MTLIGQKIIFLDVVDSTNNFVQKLIKEQNIINGTVVLANNQIKGRGQRDTIWQTEPNLNLIFSTYIEYFSLNLDKQSSINHWISLSILNVLKKLKINCFIKWPNDIITKNGKIAGILIENTISENFIKNSIIGIGLNVNQIKFNSDISATSICLEKKQNYNVNDIALMLINELNYLFNDIIDNNLENLKNKYLENLWGKNKLINFIRNEKKESGVILDTDNYGKLIMKTCKGIEHFNLKEIQLIIN
jgi:BirA family biotin operon repressor/biotin-[acetyl-CoA-carboxylase] ligase